jgi:single-strand selective monofunctional uracil DNA glycosylase
MHLQQVVEILGATQVIGVGAYAEKQAKKALVGMDIEITRIPHPSPASPLANRNGGADWRNAVKKVLSEL